MKLQPWEVSQVCHGRRAGTYAAFAVSDTCTCACSAASPSDGVSAGGGVDGTQFSAVAQSPYAAVEADEGDGLGGEGNSDGSGDGNDTELMCVLPRCGRCLYCLACYCCCSVEATAKYVGKSSRESARLPLNLIPGSSYVLRLNAVRMRGLSFCRSLIKCGDLLQWPGTSLCSSGW